MTHTVVTGGAGFLGSHLCARLLASGHRVTCVDDLSSGAAENVAAFRAEPRFRLVRRDVIDAFPRDWTDVDEIYNLACPAAPTIYQADPLRTMKTCVLGAFNVLELARRNDARVIQSSTSEVYGDPAVHPQVESYAGNVSTLSVRACYDEGKRSAETIFMDHRRRFGTSIGIVRIFNTYGPRMHPHDGRVVLTFLRQGLAGEPLTVHGTGAQTRSFCYVDDVVDALIAMMTSSGEPTGPINVGNPQETTVLRLAETIATLSGTDATITFLPPRADDPRRRRPDITLAQDVLGWRPTIGLDDGLRATRDHLIPWLNGPGAPPGPVLTSRRPTDREPHTPTVPVVTRVRPGDARPGLARDNPMARAQGEPADGYHEIRR